MITDSTSNSTAKKMDLLFNPVEKNSICRLGMFWSMAAGLSWFKLVMCWPLAVPEQELVA